MNEKMLAFLVCPECKGKLIWRASAQELLCVTDQLAFPVRDDIPVMLVSEARALTTEELAAC